MTDIDTQVGELMRLIDDFKSRSHGSIAMIEGAIRAALQSAQGAAEVCEVCGGTGGVQAHQGARTMTHPCPRGCTEPAPAPAGEVVAWALRRKCNGYVRGVQTTAPSEESMEIAEIDGEEYIALYTAQPDQSARIAELEAQLKTAEMAAAGYAVEGIKLRNALLLRDQQLDEAIRAAPQSAQAPATPVDIGGYVHPVPNHCDRITWRGSYYHLPPSQAPAGEAVYQLGTRSPNGIVWCDVAKEQCEDAKFSLRRVLYTSPPDQSARIAELEALVGSLEETQRIHIEQLAELTVRYDARNRDALHFERRLCEEVEKRVALSAERDEARSQLAESQAREQALRKAITKAHDSMFAQCLSNPIKNAWSKEISVLALNEAADLAIDKPDTSALSAAIAAAVEPIQKQLADAQAREAAQWEALQYVIRTEPAFATVPGIAEIIRHGAPENSALSAAIAEAVEPLQNTLDEIGGLSHALRVGGPAPEDLQGLSDALTRAVDMAHDALALWRQSELDSAAASLQSVRGQELPGMWEASDLAGGETDCGAAGEVHCTMTDTASQVLCDTAKALGCEPDNEVILQSISDLQRQLAEAQARLLKAAPLIQHAKGCTFATPLPTGTGTWGCSCGKDELVLDGELLSDTPALSAAIAEAVEPIQKQLAEAQARLGQVLHVADKMRSSGGAEEFQHWFDELKLFLLRKQDSSALSAAIAEAVEPLRRQLNTLVFHLQRGDFKGQCSLAEQAVRSIKRTLSALAKSKEGGS